ncbi:MAG: DpnI domain-containing protein [Verrucomicrobiota bacterium]
MTGELAAAYKSGSQRAKNVTEAWGADNFYCPNCSSPKLDWLKSNTHAHDYRCPSCEFLFQLKSQKSPLGQSVTDGAYGAMMKAIQADQTPNFYFMHYDLATWSIRNLLLVPSFAFPTSAIIKRNPLAATARRAGWIGCNIALHRIPADARISLVKESNVVPAKEVREQFKRVKPLQEISVAQRGWTLDVLTAVRELVTERGSVTRSTLANPTRCDSQSRAPGEFTNEDIYALAPHFEKLHPGNRHVKDKIRQQLQVLRDLGLLLHIGKGEWRVPL